MSEQHDDTRPIEEQLASARKSADAWRERWIAEADVTKTLLEACKAALARLAATRISDVEVFHQISAAVALAEASRDRAV